MTKHNFTGIRKLLLTCSAAAVIVTGTALPTMSSLAAAVRPSNISQTANREIDKEEIHVQTMISLIAELPGQYSSFTSRDHQTFNRAKQLMEELTRNEMFRLIDQNESMFNKYNDLYTQEKMNIASK